MWKEAKEQAQFNINELVHRDFLDVSKCDVMLVECTNPYRNYWGTISEVVIAREVCRPAKPVVAFVGQNRLEDNNGEHYSFWMDHWCTAIVATMEEAIDYICKVLDYGE
jgi:hypothetical protein